MIPAAVGYHRATSLEDAFEALAEPEARALAGGQSLLPDAEAAGRAAFAARRHRRARARPDRARRTDELRIGALATWDALVAAPELEAPGLAAVCRVRGAGSATSRCGTAARSEAASRTPTRPSDLPAVVLALGARLELRSPDGERTLAAADFFRSPFTTALERARADRGRRRPDSATRLRLGVRLGRAPRVRVRARRRGALVRADGTSTVALTGVGSRAVSRARRTVALAKRSRSTATGSRRRGTGATSPASSCGARSSAPAQRAEESMTRERDRRRAPALDAPEKVTGATRFAADGYVHGLLHARLVLATESHARIRGIDREARSGGRRASSRCSPPPTCRCEASGIDRTAEPLAREEVVFAGQPVAIVVAESEAAAEDGAELVSSTTSRSRRSSTSSRRWRRARRSPAVADDDEAGGDLESIHAAASTRASEDEEEELSGNVLDTVTRNGGGRRGRARVERRRRRGDVPDAVGLPGVHRAAGRDGVARADRARSSSPPARRARS